MKTWLTIAFLVSGCSFLNKPSLSKKVVVDVNGQQMTGQEFAQELAFRLKDQDALSAKDPKFVNLMKARVVEDFVVQALTETWAKENAVVVKAEDLEAQIQSVQKSYPDDLAFQQALLDEGQTFLQWRERLQRSLLQKLVQKRITEKAPPPTEAEMQAFYQENRSRFMQRETAQIRQIMVTTESDAKTIETELKKGKRMAELAKSYSASPEGAQGGMVGWVEKGLTDVFESAFRMKQGQRSPIVKSAFGYHIFEVTGRKPARGRPYNEVKDEIKSILMEKREQSLYLGWLEEQVRKARVYKDQEYIDALNVETKLQ